MGKIKYIVIEKNKPSEKAIEDFNRIVYEIACKHLAEKRQKLKEKKLNSEEEE